MPEADSLFLINEVEKYSNNPDYRKIIKEYIHNLNGHKVPVIFNVEHFYKIVNLNPTYLFKLIRRETEAYRIFYIKKHNNGKRRIAVPYNSLLQLQRWIKQLILDKISPHVTSMAYTKGLSIINNAKIHCGKKWLIKLDLSNFFESISERRVYHVFRNIGYTPYLSFMFARLCTYPLPIDRKNKSSKWSYKSSRRNMESKMINKYRNPVIGSLVQGAPTSPALANLCFYNIDNKLNTLCIENDCTYTRYSDDISISSNTLNREKAVALIKHIQLILSYEGFRLNTKKTCICPPGAKKIVTGLTANSSKPSVPKYVLMLKNYVYYINKYGLLNVCKFLHFDSIDGFKNYVYGILNYVKQIDITYYKKYKSNLDELKWPTWSIS